MFFRFWSDLHSQLGTWFTVNDYSLYVSERGAPQDIPEYVWSGTTGVQRAVIISHYKTEFVQEYDLGGGIYSREYRQTVRIDFVGQYGAGDVATGIGPKDDDFIYRQMQSDYAGLLGTLRRFFNQSYTWTFLPGDYWNQMPFAAQFTSSVIVRLTEAPVMMASRRWIQKNYVEFYWRTVP